MIYYLNKWLNIKLSKSLKNRYIFYIGFANIITVFLVIPLSSTTKPRHSYPPKATPTGDKSDNVRRNSAAELKTPRRSTQLQSETTKDEREKRAGRIWGVAARAWAAAARKSARPHRYRMGATIMKMPPAGNATRRHFARPMGA